VLLDENDEVAKLTPREFLRLAEVESWRSRGVPGPELGIIKDTVVDGAFPEVLDVDEDPSLMTMDVKGTERVLA